MEVFKIILMALIFHFSSVIANNNCQPTYFKPPNLSAIPKLVSDIQTSKWNKQTPTHEELADEITFWCIEP